MRILTHIKWNMNIPPPFLPKSSYKPPSHSYSLSNFLSSLFLLIFNNSQSLIIGTHSWVMVPSLEQRKSTSDYPLDREWFSLPPVTVGYQQFFLSSLPWYLFPVPWALKLMKLSQLELCLLSLILSTHRQTSHFLYRVFCLLAYVFWEPCFLPMLGNSFQTLLNYILKLA